MAVARKSDVSATGSWFWRSIQKLGNRPSTSRRRTHAKSVPVQTKVSMMSAPVSPTDTFQQRSVVTRHTRSSLPLEKPYLERLQASVEVSSLDMTPLPRQFDGNRYNGENPNALTGRPNGSADPAREQKSQGEASTTGGKPFRSSPTESFPPTSAHPATASSTLIPKARGSLLNSPYQNTQVSSRRQRRSSKNLSASTQQFPLEASTAQRMTINGAVPTTPVQLDKQKVPSIPVMSNSASMPLWLLRLYTIHRHSSVVAFLLVTVTLVVYGWTVYSQQLWNQSFRKLQDLQHHERQLTTTNEVLKEKMAQEAQQPAAGLGSPTPTGTIFLPTASVGPNPVSPNTTPNSETQLQTANPVGY